MAAQVPEDLRTLKDFPVYDASFQDGPCFRQNLSHWSLKTEKLSTAMTNLANSLQVFHSSGLEHCKAAVNMVQSMQEMANLCGNTSASSVGTPLHKFSDELSKIWRYYDAFLTQTEMLHILPFQELANSFVNLKKLYNELLHYRKEYVTASEKLCASRHLSNLPDKTSFTALTEACYSAQKTYRLVLCKYLTLLRQAHTKDMMSLLKRVMDHILSMFAYHDNSTKALKEMEPEMNSLLTKTKEWDGYFDKELLRWGKLHTSVQRHIMAEFQFNVGLLSPQHNADVSWRDSKESSSSKHRPKKHVNIATPPHTRKSFARSPSRDSCNDHSSLDKGLRMHPADTSPSAGDNKQPSPKKRSPVARTRSTPHVNPDDGTLRTRVHNDQVTRRNRKMVRSSSNPDLLAVRVMEFKDDSDSDDSELPSRNSSLHSSLKSSGFHDLIAKNPLMIRHSQNTVESAANAVEELLSRTPSQQSPSHHTSTSSHFGGPFAAIKQKRAKKKEEKKMKRNRKLSNSVENILNDKDTSTGSGENMVDTDRCTSDSPPGESPKVFRKNSKIGPGIFKRNGRSKSKEQFTKESSSKESSLSPPPNPTTPLTPLTLVNGNGGGGHFDKFKPKPAKKPIMLRTSSTSKQPEVSSPTLLNKQPELAHFDLQGLVKPVDENWTKCGYLWLRMKLPNNHYAWTHIYCVVDKQKGELMIQEQSLPQPRPLENLMLCNTRPCTPDYIDRNYCFRVISPSSEHLFQALNEQQLQAWVRALQETTEEALKNSNPAQRAPPPNFLRCHSADRIDGSGAPVPNALNLILSFPGNRQCADCCSTTDLEWASVNLGIVLCIKCSGVHRGLGVHVSKVRSLNLDKWDKASVDFMQSQGNDKSNSYYEANLGRGLFEAESMTKPLPNASKDERMQFIQLKYVALAFVPDHGDDRMTPL